MKLWLQGLGGWCMGPQIQVQMAQLADSCMAVGIWY